MRRKLEERNRIPDAGSIGWIMEETAGAAAIPQSALGQPAPFTQGSLAPSVSAACSAVLRCVDLHGESAERGRESPFGVFQGAELCRHLEAPLHKGSCRAKRD